ncbi:MAG TPA: hypothetical protein PK842_02705 [Smithella sp.]|jgi:hypothetical protein|nr:hypothetical protein [Smithella sp.]NMC96319.1 hypothetical protein [Deltaproteobacteria bacterium]OQC53250.1 MAG: hypothetical protein BWX55_01246 [Deltaproteobacteria bacterium ADurb.Bin022]HNQ64433.1 hypothetical protein [Smithella sp.]HOE31854.1 hypothetical protein [Smithella sp.]
MIKLQKGYLKISCVLMCLLALIFATRTWACDVAVVSGKVTTDGKPLIWKNFDNSSSDRQQVAYFPAKKSGPGGYLMVYRFENGMKLLNNGSAITPSGGVNESGFAIAGTSVYQDYNLMAEPVNINTVLMEEALATCTTLAEFESLLKRWPYYHWGTVISANFVVIDAKGGAALYECFTGHLNTGLNLMQFRKNDANTGKITNQYGWTLKRAQSNFIGFHIMTNYNYYIPWNVGQDRKYRAEALLTQLATEKRINYRTVMREVAKDVVGKQVQTDLSSETNYSTTYCLSRNATRSSIVVRGVASGDNPRLATMWVNLGEPSVGVFVPFFAAARGTSELARVDTYANGAWRDYDDSCLLNQAISARETYGSLIYSSNEGDVIWGMYDNYINKVELAKVQQWTFQIEDTIIDNAESFLSSLQSNPAQITAFNLKDFADYCADYAYENFETGSADAFPWQY